PNAKNGSTTSSTSRRGRSIDISECTRFLGSWVPRFLVPRFQEPGTLPAYSRHELHEAAARILRVRLIPIRRRHLPKVLKRRVIALDRRHRDEVDVVERVQELAAQLDSHALRDRDPLHCAQVEPDEYRPRDDVVRR